MADEKILIEIDVDNEQAIKDINEQNAAIERLQNENKELAAQGKKNSQQYQQNAAQIQKLNSARRQNVKLIASEKGSLNELRANLARLTTQRNAINASTTKGAAEFQRLTQEIKRQNTAIKQAEAAGGDFRRNVGNYGDAIGQVNPAIGGMINQIRGLTTAAKAFIATPLGLILTGIVAAFAAVTSYFKRTEEGANQLSEAMAYAEGIFSSVLDVVGQLGKFLITVFVNNVKIAINTFKIQMQGLESAVLAVNAGFQKLFGSAEEYNKAVQELEASNNKVKELAKENVSLIGDQVDAGKELVTQTVDIVSNTLDNAEANMKLQEAENALVKAKRSQQIVNAELQRQIFEGLRIAKDENLTYEEREKALNKANEAEQQLADNKVKIAKIEADVAKQRSELYSSDAAELDAVAAAQAKVIQLQTESERTRTKIQSTALTFQKQREADANKEVARLEKLAEKERNLALQKEQARIKDIEDEQERYNAQVLLDDQEYERQKTLLQQTIDDERELKFQLASLEFDYNQQRKALDDEYTVNAIKNNEALKQEEARNAQERIRVEQQVANSRAQLLASGFTLAKQLASKNEKLVKAIGLVEVAVNTARGIMNAFATLPYPAAVPAAIAVAATGAAQALAITSASPSGGAIDTSLPSTGGTTTPNTSAADQALAEQAALESAIANLGLTVSVTEINDAQNNVQVTQQTSTI